MVTSPDNVSKHAEAGGGKDFRFHYFSQLLGRKLCVGKINERIGKLTDLVFRLCEPYPEAVGIYLEHGWGQPTQFIPWDRVVKIDDDAVFVQPAEGERYPPFVDQPGWIMLNEHLMGKTILDMDGRRTEVVNDVHLLESKGRMVIVHVDISFNGFLRKWGLGGFHWMKDVLISWRYVQPLSLEDAVASDTVSLSVTRAQVHELPSEDLADALEELSGKEQEAVFSVLDSEKAAETLMEAEPRAQRQIIANLRKERARNILSEMSVPQLADLLSVLPHDDKVDLMALLPRDQARRIEAILSEREATAGALMSSSFVAMSKETTAGGALAQLRTSNFDHDMISYIYVVGEPNRALLGVVDLRELVLAQDIALLADLMVSPVVAADSDDLREDLEELFAKYHYRMVPVVDKGDHLLGVIHFKDIMKGLVARAAV
ncbi:MAG: CBS domain-containing protein [Thermoguttaceae bacterium]|jgi:CBS domain-containing protein/sporulation protein YlmC with PRC-barrel domain